MIPTGPDPERSLERSLAILRKAVAEQARRFPPGWSEPPAYWEYSVKLRYRHAVGASFARGVIHIYLMMANRSFDAERPFMPPDKIVICRRSRTNQVLWQQGRGNLPSGSSMFSLFQEIRIDLSQLTASAFRQKWGIA